MVNQNLKKAFLATIFLLPTIVLGSQSAVAGSNDLEIRIINNTSEPITDIRVDPSFNKDWGDNILEGYGNIARKGGYVDIIIPDGKNVCVYDTYTEWGDGTSKVETRVDFCNSASGLTYNE